jgi:hydroxymethylpyrimidine pyrophosphatase-like HAD family hydrolase
MLQWAGRSYAVGNAHPSVVEVADAVIGTNDEDAVADVIERLLKD